MNDEISHTITTSVTCTWLRRVFRAASSTANIKEGSILVKEFATLESNICLLILGVFLAINEKK